MMNTHEEDKDLTDPGGEIPPPFPWRKMLAFSFGVLAVMLVASFWVGASLPADHKYPIHWGADGKPNGFGTRAWVLYPIPVTTAGIIALLALLPRFEPRKGNLRRSSRAFCSLWATALVLFAVLHAGILAAASGYPVNMNRIMLPMLGWVFIILGNYMGKIQSNFMFGIRTPWTLSSELSWNKTHRLGGRLFFLEGIAIFVAGLSHASEQWLVFAVVGGLLGTAVLLCVYSYVVWKADPKMSERLAGS